MATDFMEFQAAKLPANILSHRLRVDRVQWLQTAKAFQKSNARFLTLWGADDRDRDGGFRIYAAYLLPDTVMVVEHFIEDSPAPAYPSIAGFYPAALRMQRAVSDLLGISTNETDTRGWLHHGGWPETLFPLRRDVDGSQQYLLVPAPYSFV
ncbi:MAG TPA: NADH-quinone oxidoreductase subunit C, partial [Acidobacteriaceae bacterium]|nr:NADH-quinone oxidoreductase subunit C [Acidobacteriaceae bacterium]